jgi:acetolactate synthase-1/3 small subunit
MRHIINLEVENQSGVLARIAGLFSARGFNIESISAGRADPKESVRVCLVIRGDDLIVEQIKKQLNKLIDVIRVTDVTQAKNNFVSRELLLIKVNCPASKRADITQLVNIFGAKVVDISNRSIGMEVAGIESKINAFIETLRPFGIKEVARTGTIAMLRDFSG